MLLCFFSDINRKLFWLLKLGLLVLRPVEVENSINPLDPASWEILAGMTQHLENVFLVFVLLSTQCQCAKAMRWQSRY